MPGIRHAVAAVVLGSFGVLGCAGDEEPSAPTEDALVSAEPPIETGTDPSAPAQGDGEGTETAVGPCDREVVAGAVTPLAEATTAEEYALAIDVRSASKTSWGEAGNEAVVLEVLRGESLVGHVVLHQGLAPFTYGMHVGALAAGESLGVRVSPLTAKNAEKRACLSKATLTPASKLGAAAEGLAHAPIFKWPTEKSFDDLPIVSGWSKAKKSYQIVYTNENGGTCELCGGGARGLRSEIARWGRGFDIEGAWSYGGAGSFERCDGRVAQSPGKPRMDSAHPVLYYGDGHNRLFESRGGYGKTCGSGGDEAADGKLAGWNDENPGDGADKDGPFTIVLRPLPVDLDAIGFAKRSGRREALADRYAPWLYRLTHEEVTREGKIDGKQALGMSRYLFVDVTVRDVDGSGDATCGPLSFEPGLFARVSGGFVVRAISKSGVVSSGPQMTATYFGGAENVKRIAIPLAKGVEAKDIQKLVFDAYDGDGMYLLSIGDAFVPRPSGTNGAKLDYVHEGETAIDVYVDDDKSSCTGGKNASEGKAYPCVGSAFELTL